MSNNYTYSHPSPIRSPSLTYQTSSSKRVSPTAISSYFYKELSLKNKHISDLQSRIASLLATNQSLTSKITELKSKNYNLSLQNEKDSNHSLYNSQQQQTHFTSQIQALKNENTFLKQLLNKEDNVESDYHSTVMFKLSNAQKEIDNLSIMNAYKDTILYHMQQFYNKLNNVIGVKYQYDLDFCNDDLNTYMKRLKEIERKVMNDLQCDDSVNDNGTYTIDTTAPTIKADVNEERINRMSKSNNFKTFKPKTKCIKFKPSELYVNTKNCECRYYGNNKSKVPTIRNNDTGTKHNNLLRTPPRDNDYIAPLSAQVAYLKTINASSARSRSSYNY